MQPLYEGCTTDKLRKFMLFTRTGKTQTERTKTGIITTAQETNGKYNRWVQIGYTSISKNRDGKEFVNGPYGHQLLAEWERV